MNTYKFFILKHLKSLQHVSIQRSSSGSYAVPCQSHIFKLIKLSTVPVCTCVCVFARVLSVINEV